MSAACRSQLRGGNEEPDTKLVSESSQRCAWWHEGIGKEGERIISAFFDLKVFIIASITLSNHNSPRIDVTSTNDFTW